MMVVLKLTQCRIQGLATGPGNKATVQVVMWCKLHTLLALVSSPESSSQFYRLTAHSE